MLLLIKTMALMASLILILRLGGFNWSIYMYHALAFLLIRKKIDWTQRGFIGMDHGFAHFKPTPLLFGTLIITLTSMLSFLINIKKGCDLTN